MPLLPIPVKGMCSKGWVSLPLAVYDAHGEGEDSRIAIGVGPSGIVCVDAHLLVNKG